MKNKNKIIYETVLNIQHKHQAELIKIYSKMYKELKYFFDKNNIKRHIKNTNNNAFKETPEWIFASTFMDNVDIAKSYANLSCNNL